MAREDVTRKLTAAGWGLFFIWVAIALLAELGAAVALLGIGIITLGCQMARRFFDLGLESFWVVVGCLLLLGGICHLLGVKLPIIPIVLILAGLAILASILKGKRPGQQ